MKRAGDLCSRLGGLEVDQPGVGIKPGHLSHPRPRGVVPGGPNDPRARDEKRQKHDGKNDPRTRVRWPLAAGRWPLAAPSTRWLIVHAAKQAFRLSGSRFRGRIRMARRDRSPPPLRIGITDPTGRRSSLQSLKTIIIKILSQFLKSEDLSLIHI